MSCCENDHVDLDNTWSHTGSLDRGYWAPYTTGVRSKPSPCKHSKENFCSSCRSNYSHYVFNGTTLSNITPRHFTSLTKETYSNQPSCDDYVDLSRTWSQQQPYTTN